MTDEKFPQPSTSDIRDLTAVLAAIIADGLSTQQRQSIAHGLSVESRDIQSADESSIYRALRSKFADSGEWNYLLELALRVSQLAVFQRDVTQKRKELEAIIDRLRVRERLAAHDKPYVFVMLPFDEKFFLIYQRVVRPVLHSLGCEVEHIRERPTVGELLPQIEARIERAHFCVAETSGRNPNVFYEIGYARGLRKDVILLDQDRDRKPFNVRHFNHIQYRSEDDAILSHELREMALTILKS